MSLGLSIAAFALFCIAGVASGMAGRSEDWSQRNFPCAEDAALVYIDTPSHDRVGCVPLEALR